MSTRKTSPSGFSLRESPDPFRLSPASIFNQQNRSVIRTLSNDDLRDESSSSRNSPYIEVSH